MSPTSRGISSGGIRPEPRDGWVRLFQARPGSRVRLFCFAYAGGGPAAFRTWGADLPSSIEVAAVQLPGRESRWREKAFDRMEPLADEVTKALVPHFDRPFAFFGHSMGALLGYEVLRRLRDRGLPMPMHFFASGRRAPSVEGEDDPLYNLPRDEFLERLRGLTGTPDEVLQNEELMGLLEPLLRADFAACETYVGLPVAEPFDLPITAFGGEVDEDIPATSIEAWRRETRGRFKSRMFPGGHFFLNDHREMVLRAIASELAPFS